MKKDKVNGGGRVDGFLKMENKRRWGETRAFCGKKTPVGKHLEKPGQREKG